MSPRAVVRGRAWLEPLTTKSCKAVYRVEIEVRRAWRRRRLVSAAAPRRQPLLSATLRFIPYGSDARYRYRILRPIVRLRKSELFPFSECIDLTFTRVTVPPAPRLFVLRVRAVPTNSTVTVYRVQRFGLTRN